MAPGTSRQSSPNIPAKADFAKLGSEVPFLQPSWPALKWAALGRLLLPACWPVLLVQSFCLWVWEAVQFLRCFVFRVDVSPLIHLPVSSLLEIL